LPLYTLASKKEFGTLTVYNLTPKPDKVTAIDSVPTRLVDSIDAGDMLRITWQDIFNKTNAL